MNYHIISTGSQGNALFLECGILIDCGVPYAQISRQAKDIKLILLTHQHSDHFNLATLSRLSRERPTLRIATGEHLLPLLHQRGIPLHKMDVIPENRVANYGDFSVSPFPLFHDVPNVGWRIFTPEEKLIYATDTGSIDHIVAKNYDFYFLEANYKTEELEERIAEKLEKGEFIYEKRVMYTHLSEEKATAWLAEMMGERSKYQFIHMHQEKEEVREFE